MLSASSTLLYPLYCLHTHCMNTESANSLPIAGECAIPSLPELCAYRLGDTSYLSVRQVVPPPVETGALGLSNAGWVAVQSPCRARNLAPLREIEETSDYRIDAPPGQVVNRSLSGFLCRIGNLDCFTFYKTSRTTSPAIPFPWLYDGREFAISLIGH